MVVPHLFLREVHLFRAARRWFLRRPLVENFQFQLCETDRLRACDGVKDQDDKVAVATRCTTQGCAAKHAATAGDSGATAMRFATAARASRHGLG